MKILKYTATIASCAAIATLLPSCDSGEIVDPSSLSSDPLVSESLDAPVLGDQIEYQAELNAAPLNNGFTYEGLSNNVSDIVYIYERTSAYEFTHTAVTLAEQNLTDALNKVLSGEVGAVLGNRLRVLLHNGPAAPYTTAEILEIREILNPSGANLILNEAGDGLRTLGTLTYTHAVKSTNLDRRNGSMAGIYTIDSVGSEIIFRNMTAGEADSWREMTIQDFIPAISDIPYELEDLEKGTWVTDLINP